MTSTLAGIFTLFVLSFFRIITFQSLNIKSVKTKLLGKNLCFRQVTVLTGIHVYMYGYHVWHFVRWDHEFFTFNTGLCCRQVSFSVLEFKDF